MKSAFRRPSGATTVVLCTLVAVLASLLAGPSMAAADTATTTTSVPVRQSGTGTTTFGTTTFAPTTTITLAPADTTTTVPPGVTTTVAPSTTTTTLDPVQLARLINSLNADVAQAQAVNDYLAAQAAAATLGAGQALPATADPVLVAAAAARLKAANDQAAAQLAYQQARHRIGRVALALYLGEQNPSAGTAITNSPGDRSAFLASILDGEQRTAKAAQADLAAATAAAAAGRLKADQLVQTRTSDLQAVALHATAAAAAAGPAGTSGALSAPGAFGAAQQNLLTQASPSILGPAVLSADELVGWYTASGRSPSLTVPLPELAGDFETVGAAAGVRPDIAFAQSIIETSYFGFPSFGQVAPADNNFAGIGACDSCARGFTFPTALTGVQAQMQLLHEYATTSAPVAGPLPGPFTVAGCCPTWMQLAGVWATATDYGVSILHLYLTMVQWALARRTAAAHL